MGINQIMPRAVFLDRDGVLNRLIWNPQTKQHESPHILEDLRLMSGMEEELKRLAKAGWLLFLISNQPSYALGKTSLENIRTIHQYFERKLQSAGVRFQEFYYCYHHPQGVVPEYSGECECRKPKPTFIQRAQAAYALDLAQSWLIGDQDTDIQCGQAAGVKTILINVPESAERRGKSQPDYQVDNLKAAVDRVLENSK
jgi:D-glycero-D-manno-heptose 1,7-bisphosphate phosphatase